MPAGASVTPGRLPIRLSFFFGFPENKIQCVFFQLSRDFDISVARLEIVYIFMGKFTVIFEFTGSVINGPVCCGICISLFDQLPNHLNHAVNFLSSQRMRRGRIDIHTVHVYFTFFDKALGYFFCCSSLFDCLIDNFVIHICKIGYKIYIISFVFHVSSYRIKNDHRSCISDMDVIVYGRSADIHFDFSFLYRNKFFFPAG